MKITITLHQNRNNKSFVGKRIILLSSLYEAFSSQKLDDIIASLKEQEIEFTFL